VCVEIHVSRAEEDEEEEEEKRDAGSRSLFLRFFPDDVLEQLVIGDVVDESLGIAKVRLFLFLPLFRRLPLVIVVIFHHFP